MNMNEMIYMIFSLQYLNQLSFDLIDTDQDCLFITLRYEIASTRFYELIF